MHDTDVRFHGATGWLISNLDAAAIDPPGIAHAYPDHIRGVRDNLDEVLLPDAEYLIGETKWPLDTGRHVVVPRLTMMDMPARCVARLHERL
ncbi:hypothetical protein SAMN05444398_101818 [Roseovarius pacificus]|uniref:Uncharacterized protein n=1 Tax=Roseovarius pacificus TaxID=337701 RepID=A0A1M6YE62_9RHOB|nr:hypothetical protein [Roseovarius pacificus]GGO50994.1 hypothetical protein GCM10011315_03080 [Roseovarius pacificus]SHL16432.1 hypothetical protein SAMN05444398_101818 [Roseovarius pacificus]